MTTTLDTEFMGLSVRVRKAMHRLRVDSIDKVCTFGGDELLELRNFGMSSLNELRDWLAERGRHLRGEKPATAPPPPQPAVAPGCERCRFFDVAGSSFGAWGLCRRGIPVAGPSGQATWPTVRRADWCGEFQPKQGEDA
jgi:hypothetical protein